MVAASPSESFWHELAIQRLQPTARWGMLSAPRLNRSR
jgi:hypothetical protein